MKLLLQIYKLLSEVYLTKEHHLSSQGGELAGFFVQVLVVVPQCFAVETPVEHKGLCSSRNWVHLVRR